MKLLKYSPTASSDTDSQPENRIQQLVQLARALTTEVESLRTEVATVPQSPKQIDLDNDGIDFYQEIERYEIDLIESALNVCDGNQSRAARLLRMKATTLNAKIKHYGLHPARSITLQRTNVQVPS
ncbi:MAG TPA: helix-turn-helix domain-containing protein [Pyrinomonadaceae bacterium]|nr:helix-turn-helix domain-containing protein [Pyrinomonadaceae bacterium]